MTFFFVVGIFGEEKNLECFFDWLEARLEFVEFGLRHGADLGVRLGEHGFGVGDAGLQGAILAKLFDGRFHVAMLLGDLAVVFLVADDAGVGELATEVFVTGFHLVETVKHKGS